MKIYGKGDFDAHTKSYNEDHVAKTKRMKSDIKDIIGMIRGSSMTNLDKARMFAMAADLLLKEIN